MQHDQQIIIGESPSFLEVIEQASRAARHDRPVLVIEERGTGKELIASRLHFLSPRWEQKYVHNQNIKARKELDVAPLDYQKTIENYEKDLLNNALKVSKFNQKEADKLLNLNYHKLRHQLKKHNLLS